MTKKKKGEKNSAGDEMSFDYRKRKRRRRRRRRKKIVSTLASGMGGGQDS